VARTPIIAGNWKMNTTAQTARELAEGIVEGNLDTIAGVENQKLYRRAAKRFDTTLLVDVFDG